MDREEDEEETRRREEEEEKEMQIKGSVRLFLNSGTVASRYSSLLPLHPV